MINKNEFVNSPEVGAYADVFDYLLHYYEKGEGEPLLLIHGIGQSIYTFRRNIDELSKHYRVIALDLPGHGYSDTPEIAYTLEDFTNAIIVFLSVLRLDKVHIFAFSTGAVIAQNLATLYPEKVDRMILISPGGITGGYPFLYRALGMPILSDVLVTLGMKERGVARCLLPGYFDRTMVDEKLIEQTMLPYSSPQARDALATALAHWDDREVYENLHQITNPTYIFWGECDEWHPMAMLDDMAEMMPYAFIATVRNAGHMIHEEKSREINRKVIECLSEPLIAPPVAEAPAEEELPETEEITEAPVEAPVEEPMEEVIEAPVEEIAEETIEEIAEEPIEDPVEEPTLQPEEDTAEEEQAEPAEAEPEEEPEVEEPTITGQLSFDALVKESQQTKQNKLEDNLERIRQSFSKMQPDDIDLEG